MLKSLAAILLLLTIACNKEGSSGEAKTSVPNVNDSISSVTPDGSPAPDNTTQPSVTPDESNNDSTVTLTFTQQFMELINDHRRSIGLDPMIHDEGLGGIATKHSQNMANGSVAFGHDGFSSRCSAGRVELGGGNWCGENVAMGQKTPQAAFNSWMNSSGHRANIEQTRVTHTGFGYAKNSKGTYYWTQIFLEYR